ncbi:MAG TPA: D-alanyl-D-alanine carboxypeptidase [Xanthobacteraceae bacterium]|nr:D-alanyl-D-alanine carboxypeptidase [Xanthobacteraceae bacterium]
MLQESFGARLGLRGCLLSLAAVAAALTISSDAALARHHHRVYAHHRHHGHGEAYNPPYSSIVVDANSGAVLEAVNPDASRHPASLTKVMTLYLLFERLDAGRIRLDTPLRVSEHASDQDPTKLGLKPGQTITVENAIKGIVTRSANDAAVVIAENLGGSEPAFAKLMTEKARALGMAHTTYVNASGLPDDDQVTTARDQVLLGRAIQDRFPRYYKFFSTQEFEFHGTTIRGHNHLLSEVPGVDGIKTGFTLASGFNLLTSLHRDGRFLVAAVLGGPSASERDARMRELLADHIKEASLHRTAPMIADVPIHRNEPIAFTKSPLTTTKLTAASYGMHADPQPTASVNSQPVANPDAPIKPVLVRTIPYRTVPVQTASLAPMPMLVPAAPPAPQPAAPPAPPMQRPAMMTPPAAAAELPPAPVVAASAPAVLPMRQPAAPAKVVAEAPMPAAAETAPLEPRGPEIADADPARIRSDIAAAPVHAHGGWLIQIGAFDDENDAKEHLTSAQQKVHGALAAKDPFTERIQKGDKALYRARFAGFDEVTAKAACKALKRSDFQCMALKD